MSRSRLITDTVKELEYTLAKQRAVQAVFPDAKVHHYLGFTSKSVNQNYTKFEFQRRSYGLYVLPYAEVDFTWNDTKEVIKIHSSPRANKLVYTSWRKSPVNGKRVMKFARVAINMKNNAFKDDMLNACRAEIMNFIKDNPGYHMDDKHLEPRLKKLLIFT